MNRVEIIRDNRTIYLITKDGVQEFEDDRTSAMPYRLQQALEDALGYEQDAEE